MKKTTKDQQMTITSHAYSSLDRQSRAMRRRGILDGGLVSTPSSWVGKKVRILLLEPPTVIPCPMEKDCQTKSVTICSGDIKGD